ncbi:MAG: efflux RND transporter permease subunit [Planctomycetota bacterium]
MIAFFARHPTAANLLMVLMIAAGLLSIGGLRRETFPDAAPVKVEVSVLYPGASTDEVEQSIVQRLEEELEGVQFVKEMQGVATSSRGSVTLEMVDSGTYTRFRNEIENAVNSIDDFPSLAEPPLITRLNTKDPVLDVLVKGPTEARELKNYCESLKDRLLRSKLITEVEVTGFSDPVLRVELISEAMLRHGLSPIDVSSVISGQSVDLSAGEIQSGENTLVRVQEERRGVDAMKDLVVKAAPGGGEVRLGEIATITDEFKLDEDRIRVSGQRGAVLKILKAKTQDTIQVAEEVKRVLQDERERSPDVTLTVINDMSTLVQERISLLIKNGVQGCVLVFAVMWLFFNARLSFWVVFSLPVSFLAAFALVPQLGLTINMLTMVGLLMAIGVLMDDGIVIAENIARRRASGEPAMLAAVEGVREVGGGVFSSFLTTLCVLGPLIFLTGELGRILRVLPMMLLLVLAASLIEAFLILPAHLGHSLHHNDPDRRSRFRRWIDQRIDGGQERVGRLVDWTIRWRYLTLGLVVMVFFLTIGLIVGGVVRGQVFPDLEGDTIVARVLMQPGTPLTQTQAVVEDLEATLLATNAVYTPNQPDQQDLVQTTYVRFNENQDALETGPHVASLYADLLSNEVRQGRIDDIVKTWQDELGPVADVLSVTFDEPAIGPAGRAIEIQLSGLPLQALDEVSEEIQQYLRTFDGVYNVTDDLRTGQQELLVRLRPGAAGLGLTATSLAQQLRGSFQGLLSDQVQIADENYDVEVRYAIDDRNDLSDLEDARVFLPDGNMVPIAEVATLTPHRGWSRIGRFDGRQVVNVLGSVDSQRTNTIGVLAKMQSELIPSIKQQHPMLEWQIKGESERGAETGQSLAAAALIGCLGVFVILSYQFRSYIEPFIVMVAIPFAFVGVVWGHFLFGLSLSLPSMMGYASLAGIVVNDSILLMLFLKAQRTQGVAVEEAASQASRMRFRAVMITSLTTIAGLMPLLLERSLQAQVLIPIAISICFGLLASTVLILLVLPALYVILSDLFPKRLAIAEN